MGFSCIPNDLIDDPQIGAYEIAVYAIIARHSDSEGDNATPSVSTISSLAGIGETTVNNAVNTLSRLGYVAKVRRFLPNGGNTSNGYKLPKQTPEPYTATRRTGQPTEHPPYTATRSRSIEQQHLTNVPAEPEPAQTVDDQHRSFADTVQAYVDEANAAGNKNAVCMRAYKEFYGGRTPPDFGYLGRVAKKVGGHGRLIRMLAETSIKPPDGDVLAYIQAVKKGKADEEERNTGMSRARVLAE